jgi:hypothetical protein
VSAGSRLAIGRLNRQAVASDLDAATNLGPLVRYLGEAANADFTVATIPDIDHWMWVCTQPSEPGKPCAEMQFSPKVLDLIANWIQKH